MANKIGKPAANGGQIVKECLLSEGVNLSRFKLQRENSEGYSVVRRSKRKIVGGEISFPTEVQSEQLKRKLLEKIKSGEYTIGEVIVPTKVSIIIQYN